MWQYFLTLMIQDCSLARDIRNIPRIGIDFETVDYDFKPKLKRENVEEDYDNLSIKETILRIYRILQRRDSSDPKIEQVLPYIREQAYRNR